MGVKSELQRGIKSGFRNYHNNAYYKAVIDLNYRNKLFDIAFRKTTNNMNTILYGPLGTGKTYHTIDLAVRIAAPNDYTEGDHKANKEVYDQLVQTGQVVFTTFHQSMCYEDFIEGIKPLKPSEGDNFLTYDIIPGVFKQISERAQYFSNTSPKIPSGIKILSESEFRDAQFYKISLGDINDPEDQAIYDYCIENNCIAIGFMYGIDLTNKTEEEIYKIAAENNLGRFSAQALCYFSLYLKNDNYFIVSKGVSKVRAIGKVTGDYFYDKEAPPSGTNILEKLNG